MLYTPDLEGRAIDGRYELHALIGEGAFGRVYSGLDRILERPVAIKVIKPWWAEDSQWVERFQREAKLLARVNDRGIVQIFDFGTAEEGPYYVAELVPGESLADRLARERLSAAEATAIAAEICRALGSAHRQGVVHCDVKPANVMLTPDGSVKVGDFGVARLADGTSRAIAATVIGTPRYMSPEQARGLSTTPATDVYSTGVVLYEMLAGHPPFQSGSAVELGIRHIQDEPPPLPGEVPEQLRKVLARAMAKEPRRRYRDGAEMADALLEAAPAPGARTTSPPKGIKRTPRAPAGKPVGAATAPSVTIDLGAARAAEETRPLPGASSQKPPATPPARRVRRAGGRRRGLAVLACLALAAGILVLLLGGGAARTRVPDLRGLRAAAVYKRARATHVQPSFSTRHSSSPRGIAIAQDPSSGTRVDQGSSVHVVLSSGPPPVNVPYLVGESSAAAETRLADDHLRYAVDLVPAPGSSAGQVVRQSPSVGTSAPSESTVELSVAEAPRWRALTSFSGVDDGRSVPVQILGRRWRVNYEMSYTGTCLLIFTCLGPSAEALSLKTGAGSEGFELSEGSSESHVFNTGPGTYRVAVKGGHDQARWSMTIEDFY